MATSVSASVGSDRNPVVCLGCGEVVHRSSERRNLTSAASQRVVPLWKTVMDSELERRGHAADLVSMVSGVDGNGPGYMYRKFFYAYEKFLKAKITIEENVAKVITPTLISPLSSTPKRSSPNPTVFPPPKRHPQPSMLVSSSRSTVGKEPSPHVSVSCMVIRNYNIMQVYVGYKKPKTYELTPSRNPIGKAVARGRRQSVAIECLREHRTRRHLLKRVGMLVRNELILLCSNSTNSILRQQSVLQLKEFMWSQLS